MATSRQRSSAEKIPSGEHAFSSSDSRYYTKAQGTAYMLPADDEEKKRLNLQHTVLRGVFGGRLILAPVKLKPGDKILESGVGGGDWILDVLRTDEVPKGITIHGIDIEERNLPRPIPSNVTLSVNSILDLPEKWSGTYSYVHQRLLMAGLRASEWPVALSQIYKALKPGGWIEMHEAIAEHDGPEEYKNLVAHKLKHRAYESKGLDIQIGERLPALLKEAGFVDVKHEKKMYPAGKWAGERAWLAASVNGGYYRGLKKAVMEEGGFGIVKNGEEFDKAVDDLTRWWETGSDIQFGVHVSIARKPLEPLDCHRVVVRTEKPIVQNRLLVFLFFSGFVFFVCFF